MRRISHHHTEPLYSTASTRLLEYSAAAKLPPYTLMARAGESIAKLAGALYPHAQTIWVACGPGNNGGDGLVAAKHLFERSKALGLKQSIHITLSNPHGQLPPDASNALQQALSIGLEIAIEPPAHFDLAIDALLGIGANRLPEGILAKHLASLLTCAAPVLCVDTPSGLMPDT